MQKQLQEKETQIQEKIMTIRDLEKVGKITILHGIIFLGVQNVFVFIPSKWIKKKFAVSKLMNIKTINFYLKHFFVFEYLWVRRSLKILHQKMNTHVFVKLIICCQDIFAWSHRLIHVWKVVSLYFCQELDKLRTENKDMRTDMLKMAKQHQKLQHKLKDLVEFEKTKKLLEAMAFYVCTCHYCSNVHIS